VIGPAVVNVEATGFPMPSVVPGPNTWNKILILCNNKDSLLGIDSQVLEDWYIDANGTLQNVITGVLGGRRVHNGIVWPALQPGTYNLTLVLYTNDQVAQPLWYWDSPTWQLITTNYFEHTNTITVQETLSLLISIKADTAYIRTGTDSINTKLDTLKPIVDRIDGNVVTLSTTLGNVQATLNQLSPVITRIDGNVVTLSTTVGQINTTMATIGPQLVAISPAIARIETSVGTGLSGTVTSIQGDVATIKTDAGDVHAQLPNVTNYIILVIVLTLIAALAAIACLFLVFRKIA
jgi:archaellum component FlaC